MAAATQGPAAEKPCRTCTDFRSWMKSQRGSLAEPPASPGKVGPMDGVLNYSHCYYVIMGVVALIYK